MLLGHSDSPLTTVSRDSGIASLSPRGELEHHSLWLLPSQHPSCLHGENTAAAELHTGRGNLAHLYNHQTTLTHVGQIVLGFLTWYGAAGPLLFMAWGLKTPRLCTHKQSQADKTPPHPQPGEDPYSNAQNQSQVLLATSAQKCREFGKKK